MSLSHESWACVDKSDINGVLISFGVYKVWAGTELQMTQVKPIQRMEEHNSDGYVSVTVSQTCKSLSLFVW